MTMLECTRQTFRRRIRPGIASEAFTATRGSTPTLSLDLASSAREACVLPRKSRPMLKTIGCVLVLSTAVAATEASARVKRSRAISVPDISSEARITQAKPSRNAPARPLPADQTAPAQIRGPSSPVTCSPGNDTSPACYTATQQARPITR